MNDRLQAMLCWLTKLSFDVKEVESFFSGKDTT